MSKIEHVIKQSLKKSLQKENVPEQKAKKVVKKTVDTVKRAVRKTEAKVKNLSNRQKQVAKGLSDIQDELKTGQREIKKASKSKNKQKAQQPSDAQRKNVARFQQDLDRVEKYATIFKLKAKLASEKNVSTDQKLKLLKEMEDALVYQESATWRLKRILTTQSFLVTIAIIALSAYALYQVPIITELIKQIGVAITTSLSGATTAANASSYFVGAAACAAVSGAVALTGFGFGLGVALLTACGSLGATGYLRSGGSKKKKKKKILS